MLWAGACCGAVLVYKDTGNWGWGRVADILTILTLVVFVIVVIGILLDRRKGPKPVNNPAPAQQVNPALMFGGMQLYQWLTNLSRAGMQQPPVQNTVQQSQVPPQQPPS